jgi:hypothetical protein
MTKEEILNQLDSLGQHCSEMASHEEEGSTWHKDVEALEEAIKVIKGSDYEFSKSNYENVRA